MEIFRANNICKSYAGHVALDDVSISVEEGSVFGLLGPNGAGKSSLIRIINQIIAPDTGELFYNGEKLQQHHISQFGYLPEERGLYKKMKVGEQVIYLARLKGLSKHDALKKLKYWFEKFEIETWWDKKIEELSKGMQQKIQFIVTILHEPKLLIFDEPFSGFDPINANLLKREILKLKDDGATIIFSTHNMESVEELCDNITLINNSKNILSGTIDEVKEKYKSNIFKISFKGNLNLLPATLTSNYEIISTVKKGDITTIRVRLIANMSTNQLISALLPSGQLISFNEVIPTMNDVFIKVVEETNKITE